MTTSRTQLGYLDLAAFYQQAKSVRVALNDPGLSFGWLAGDLADKLLCVIDAIRNDGLDPRWNPGRDALIDVGFSDFVAEKTVNQLHQRGYKIVKDEAA